MHIINTAALRIGDYVNIDNENRTGRENSEGGKGYWKQSNLHTMYAMF